MTYFSIVLSYTEKNPTEWHPTDRVGPLSIITRGAFDTLEVAHAWAAVNIPGHTYAVAEFSKESGEIVRYLLPNFRCRLERDGWTELPSITNYDRAKEVFFRILAGLPHEEIHVLFVNGQTQIVGSIRVAQGGTGACAVTIASVFRGAILAGAVAIVVGHNHPSGDPTPSDDDRELTLRLVQAGELLGIRVLDHIVVCPENGRSFSIVDGV